MLLGRCWMPTPSPYRCIVSMIFDVTDVDSWQKGTFVNHSWTPGASMRQDIRTVTRSRRPYMILLAVEFLQLGQRAQPAVHAVLVKQQARLVKLRIPSCKNSTASRIMYGLLLLVTVLISCLKP